MGTRVVGLLTAMSLAGAFMQAGRSTGQSNNANYSLIEVWDVPDTPSRWPIKPISIDVDLARGEVYVLEGEPPQVLAMSRDGGVLRAFGASVLTSTTSIAVLQRRPDSGGLTTQIVVTQAANGSAVVFDSNGALLRIITGLSGPHDVTSTDQRFFITEPAAGKIIVLDAYGAIIDRWGGVGSVTGDLGQPTAITIASRRDTSSSTLRIAVVDARDNQLIWLDSMGRRLAERTLFSNEISHQINKITFLSSRTGYESILVSSDNGMFRIDRYSIDTVQIDAPPDFSSRAVVAVEGRTDWLPLDRWPVVYVISRQDELQRYFLDRRNRLRHTCPWVDDLPNRPWRLSIDASDAVYVASSNGVVQRYDHAGKAEKLVEVGDIDDFDVASDESISLNVRSQFVRISGNGMRYDRAGFDAHPWDNEYDCTSAGIGLQSSLDATEDGELVQFTRSGSFMGVLRLNFSSMLGRLSVRGNVVDQDQIGWWGTNPYGNPPRPFFYSDVGIEQETETSFAIDRYAGLVHVMAPNKPTKIWAVKGRPERGAFGPDGSIFILTVEGVIWQHSLDGSEIRGWSASGSLGGLRTKLVDIAVDSEGRVYALDQANWRVLIFALRDSGAVMPIPDLPAPCTITHDKSALPSTVPVGSPVTITLSLASDCGRQSSQNDILILASPGSNSWMTDNYKQAIPALLELLDPNLDRVALMIMDSSGIVIEPFTRDFAQIRSALPLVARTPVEEWDSHPLDLARAFMLANARAESNRIVLVVTPGTLLYDSTIAAERLRVAGVRAIVVADNWGEGFIAASMAYQMDDVHFAPSIEDLRQVYSHLGRDLTARTLIRSAVITDVIPANMEYVVASASPPATWDEPNRMLTWAMTSIPYSGWEATLQVVPRQEGRWPTNDSAHTTFVDGVGRSGSLTFPQPFVQVLPKPSPTPTTTATATPAPTGTPLPTTIPASNTPTPSGSPTQGLDPIGYFPLLLNETCVRRSSDVVLLIDSSHSMDESDGSGNSKLIAAANGALELVLQLKLTEGDRASVATFSADPLIVQPLSSNQMSIEMSLRSLRTSAGSRLDLGLLSAVGELLGDRLDPRSRKVIVALTDGQIDPQFSDKTIEAADAAKANDIGVFTIGLGTAIRSTVLRRVASREEWYYESPDSRQLKDIYREISGIIPCVPVGAY